MHGRLKRRIMMSLQLCVCRTSFWIAVLAVAGLSGCGDDNGTGPVTGLQPQLLTVSPDSGNVGTRVEVSGSDFESGAAVAFDAFAADSVILVDGSTLLAFAPDGLERDSLYDVRVVNPGGKSDELADAYKAVGPALQVVNGVSKPSGNTGSTIILEGRAFGDLASLGQVFFTDAAGRPVEAIVALPGNWTNEFIVTTVPSSAETGPVWVETPTGATDSITFRLAQSASFSPSLINWSATTPLPEALQGLGAVFLPIETGSAPGQLVFVTGGADGALSPKTTIRYAEIDAAGEFSTWTDGQSLPTGRAFHGAALATPFNALVDTLQAGHLYVVGGTDDTGAPVTSVFHSAVELDRTNAVWTVEPALPVSLHSMGVAVFRSWLYVAGGAGVGNAPSAAVYRARIQPDGSLGPWESQRSLPVPLAYAPLTQKAGVLYVLGGETAAVPPGDATLTGTRTSDVVYTSLDLRTGEIADAPWTLNSSTLIKSRSKHTAVAAGGWILVSGGLYNGSATSSTEHSFAAISVDGSLGSFGGATGSQTIAAAGGVPFFNHAALEYMDAAGEARVVILGGTDVTNPGTPIAAVYFY
jgi:hypothetical protein